MSVIPPALKLTTEVPIHKTFFLKHQAKTSIQFLYIYLFFIFFFEELRLGISCECQALFSLLQEKK